MCGGAKNLLCNFSLFSVGHVVPAHQIVQADAVEVGELNQSVDLYVDFSPLIVRIRVRLNIQISRKLKLLFVMILPQIPNP